MSVYVTNYQSESDRKKADSIMAMVTFPWLAIGGTSCYLWGPAVALAATVGTGSVVLVGLGAWMTYDFVRRNI